MFGYTRLVRINNMMITKKVGVTPIEDKMRETRLRWFGHIKRRSVDASVTWREDD